MTERLGASGGVCVVILSDQEDRAEAIRARCADRKRVIRSCSNAYEAAAELLSPGGAVLVVDPARRSLRVVGLIALARRRGSPVFLVGRRTLDEADAPNNESLAGVVTVEMDDLPEYLARVEGVGETQPVGELRMPADEPAEPKTPSPSANENLRLRLQPPTEAGASNIRSLLSPDEIAALLSKPND